MMASPGRQALLAGLAGGALGVGAGTAALASGQGGPGAAGGLAAVTGGLGLGGLAALATYLYRKAKNEGLVELMRRLPENSNKRDLLSDPAYQRDLDRAALMQLRPPMPYGGPR